MDFEHVSTSASRSHRRRGGLDTEPVSTGVSLARSNTDGRASRSQRPDAFVLMQALRHSALITLAESNIHRFYCFRDRWMPGFQDRHRSAWRHN